ncbi:ABC transporter permease [Spiribacter roseus]|uniref:ABC transporter permease n=1 Tax=Spiribacter roseus TaxID=1855875 RepID=UPI001330DE21|nr:ABC transporter permease [Spiribacter roseus]
MSPTITGSAAPRWAQGLLDRIAYPIAGALSLLILWWAGGQYIKAQPELFAFTRFAPEAALPAAWELLVSGALLEAASASLYRIGIGMVLAILIAVPLGIVVGSSAMLRRVTGFPFQLLRMVSPLAWMPIAVMIFATWNGAIVFLIFMAAVWPVLFSTAFAVQRIDPLHSRVARNLGASPLGRLWRLTLPSIAPDVMAGIRLALGVAWVVLVPAEYLGVTSGLGYAINDARDILAYDQLAALVLWIGVIGYMLDGLVVTLARRLDWQS